MSNKDALPNLEVPAQELAKAILTGPVFRALKDPEISPKDARALMGSTYTHRDIHSALIALADCDYETKEPMIGNKVMGHKASNEQYQRALQQVANATRESSNPMKVRLMYEFAYKRGFIYECVKGHKFISTDQFKDLIVKEAGTRSNKP